MNKILINVCIVIAVLLFILSLRIEKKGEEYLKEGDLQISQGRELLRIAGGE